MRGGLDAFSQGRSHTNTNARGDRSKPGNSSDNSWGSSCCRIQRRIRYRSSSVKAVAVPAANSLGKVSAEELRVPAPHISALVSDAPDFEFLQAALALRA